MTPEREEPATSNEWIEATAAAWLSHRDRGMNPAETADFVTWLQQDPRHAKIFAELDTTWKQFDRLSNILAPDTAEPDADMLAPRLRRRSRRAFGRFVVPSAAAAAIAVAFLHFSSPKYTAETAIGAFQRLELPDGSIAQLNTDSAIQTEFTQNRRQVHLVRGEVYFNVRKDSARPFVVKAGPVAVRAIGTAFNVRRREAAVEVLVTEGRVSLESAGDHSALFNRPTPQAEPPLLAAGERATVLESPASGSLAARSTVEKIAIPEVQRALAWQERRLEFDSTPLIEVVREFNRYSNRQLVIADPVLAQKRFSGSFRSDAYDALVRLLERDFGVTVTRGERDMVLLAGN